MKKYRTLFYHSKWGDKKWIDNAIALVTQAWHLFRRVWAHDLTWKQFWAVFKMGFSHEEIWIPDCIDKFWFSEYSISKEAFHNTKDSPMGHCYSSTMGQVRSKNNIGVNGTRKAWAYDVLKHPERWSYTEHEIEEWRFKAMVAWMDGEVERNEGYGLGEDKNVCSELSHNANVTAGELEGPHRFVSPLMDALLMVKAGKKIMPLKG